MKEFLTAIGACLDDDNWHAALALTLMVPDMARDLVGQPRGRQSYANWCDEYFVPKYTTQVGGTKHQFLTGADCYALRCAFLHQGLTDLEDHEAREALDNLVFTTHGPHCVQVERQLQLDVFTFCSDMIAAGNEWFDRHGRDPEVRKQLSMGFKVLKPPFKIDYVVFGEGPKGTAGPKSDRRPQSADGEWARFQATLEGGVKVWETTLTECRDGRRQYDHESADGTTRNVVTIPGPWLRCSAHRAGLPAAWPLEERFPAEFTRKARTVPCKLQIREDLEQPDKVDVLIYDPDFGE